MKNPLYPILFKEAEQLKLLSPEQMTPPKSAFKHLTEPASKDPNRFVAPTYGLAVKRTQLALINLTAYRQWVLRWRPPETPTGSWLCSWAETTKTHTTDCSKAMEINYMVASPEYPAAGSAMYALMSKYFRKPITSDRETSTSNSAKTAWARIETDSANWKKVPLDGYTDVKVPIQNDEGEQTDENEEIRQWVYADGSYPDREIELKDRPHTIKYSDDCPMPSNVSDEFDINLYLGSADAWKYVGPLDPKTLKAAADATFKDLEGQGFGPVAMQTDRIFSQAERMFSRRYRGVSG